MTATSRPEMVEVSACRSCGSSDLREIKTFGVTPIADRMVPVDATEPEFEAPLTLLQCAACGLCQIRETIAPRILFGADYPYYSSVSPALMAHFRKSAQSIMASRGLSAEHLVVEAASNDGYMLTHFQAAGVGVLGIDPADGPVRAARRRGVETIHDFFGHTLARDLAQKGRRADVFLANNVLAHVADVNDFVAGIGEILTDDGVAVIECPYLLDLVDHCAFDTIYHQHLLYLSLTALLPLFARHGLVLTHADRIKIHGGSVRMYVARRGLRSAALNTMLAEEARRGVTTAAFFSAFVERIDDLRQDLRTALDELKSAGSRVNGYGAAGKATTLLHYFGLDRQDLSVIFDRSPWKRGLAMPGCRIPVAPAQDLSRDTTDVVLILAWNFANEIIEENRCFTEAGGRFLIPVPRFRMVQDEAVGVSM
jgi:SAM-dependent methyltransferase